MPLLPIHKYFIFNSALLPVNEFVKSENEGGVYEVIRVIKGVPAFFEEHLNRFFKSVMLAAQTIQYTKPQIEELIFGLIIKCGVKEGNILLSYKTNLKAFFIPHTYPSEFQYSKGIKCGLMKAERHNPNVKVLQTEVRLKADSIISNHNIFEVLLIDHLNRITEGSRSNVFFVEDDNIITPPGNEVLLGITRQQTIEIAKERNYNMIERDVYVSELENFNAVFITGTSPKILPVNNIESIHYNANSKIVREIMSGYDKRIDFYIKSHANNKIGDR